jgi:hypothetical protein
MKENIGMDSVAFLSTSYSTFMRLVNSEMEKIAQTNSEEILDFDYENNYNNGINHKVTAQEALLNAGWKESELYDTGRNFQRN